MRRAIGLIVGLVLLTACGGSSAKSTSRASTTSRAIPVRADGWLDPNHIDLAGVAGVTPAEQARAEKLLRGTIVGLARWKDVAQARADGFVSIGDGFSGSEHYVHWDWIDDSDVLDPNHPESLVYSVKPDGTRVLEAAMYILPKRYRFGNAPDIGGPLVQLHSHFNECYTPFPNPKFKAVTLGDGSCPAGSERLLTNLMVHVWIRPNPCGPFAPIGGFNAGTVPPGQSVHCDRLHGSPSDD
jgi:hypothetical protein